jgi:hypothetical protein
MQSTPLTCNVRFFFHRAPPVHISILKRPGRFHTVNLLQITIMSGNTVNPNHLFKMTNFTDETQNFDPSLDDGNFMVDLDSLNAGFFSQDNGFDDSNLDGFAAAAPAFGQVDYMRQQPQEMVPMPQSLNPSPATFAPPQGPPAMPPGMSFHPAVGYFYPAQMPGFSASGAFGMAPTFPVPPAPIFNQAPAAPIAPAIPFGTALPDMTAKRAQPKRAPASNKRKYGPAAFFEDREQTKRRAIGDGNSPMRLSRDLTSPEPANLNQQKRKQTASQAAGAMKELNIATVQRCRCPPAKNVTEKHIPRPRNAFIIFRTQFSSRYRTSRDVKRGSANAHISIAAGEYWRELGVEGQRKFKIQAEIEKAEHRKQYPNYHYTPMKKIQAKFGDENCECGAYETNMAELKRLREGGATPPNRYTGASETEDDDGVYKAPRTRPISRSRANSIQAPTAQIAPFDFDADMSGFDFSLEPQENWDFDGLQAFNNATEDVNAEQQPPQRRSSRNSKKAVHYADDAGEEDVEVTTTTTATPKHRPARISTSRKSSNSSQISELNSADFKFDDAESVSSRTRSKSVSQSEDETAPPTGLSSPSSLFGDDGDVGDNIVVATPKPSPKHTVLALPPRTARQTRSQSRGRARRRS